MILRLQQWQENVILKRNNLILPGVVAESKSSLHLHFIHRRRIHSGSMIFRPISFFYMIIISLDDAYALVMLYFPTDLATKWNHHSSGAVIILTINAFWRLPNFPWKYIAMWCFSLSFYVTTQSLMFWKFHIGRVAFHHKVWQIAVITSNT